MFSSQTSSVKVRVVWPIQYARVLVASVYVCMYCICLSSFSCVDKTIVFIMIS